MHVDSPAATANAGHEKQYGWLTSAVIVLTTLGSLLLIHVRMMWADELLSYWGDRLPSAADVLHVQLNNPISLDPPTYHLLAHWSMQVFGQGALGMRLPALLGVVLSQVALFFLVRRISGSRAAVVAAALPAALGPFWYSAEGRPYGWLLGMYGVAMLCWHVATFGDVGDGAVANGSTTTGEKQVPSLRYGMTKGGAGDRVRLPALAGLVLAIAGAITSHYFGVLILLPLAAGELVRLLERRREMRRIDWPVAGALMLGAASVALILPFQHALKVYQQHYYNRHVTLGAIKLGYTNAISQSVAATCVIVLLVGIAGYLDFRKKRAAGESTALCALLTVLALMPVWCFLFERFVTHSMEGRYAVPASLAFVVIIAVVLGDKLRRNAVFAAVLGVVVLLGLVSIAAKVRRERRFRADFMADLTLPPAVARDPAKRVYLNSFGNFLQDQYYAPQELQSRLTYVYDAQEEISWKGRDTHSISGINVQHYSPLQVAEYSTFLREQRPVALLYDVEDWEWLGQDLARRNLLVTPVGTLMLGKLQQVETHPSGMASPVPGK